MMEGGTKGDRRDVVAKNPFETLQEYDAKMQEILSIADELSAVENEEGKKAMASDLQEKIKSVLSTPEFENIIPSEAKEYFEHDASGFRRRVLAFLGIIKRDLQRYVDGGRGELPDLGVQFSFVQKNWLKYRLVLEDLLARAGVDNGEVAERDKQKNVEELLLALDDELGDRCGNSSWSLEKEFTPSFEEIAKTRVGVQFGAIFNFLQNCISNATHPNIKASKFKFKIAADADTMTIEFWDNGVGMDDKTKKRIFNKGFSTKGGHGLGLAQAPKRFAKYDANVEVVSNSNPSPGSDEWATKFILKVPIIKE